MAERVRRRRAGRRPSCVICSRRTRRPSRSWLRCAPISRPSSSRAWSRSARIPDSDHLHLTKVDMGSGELLDVVCGAPERRRGQALSVRADRHGHARRPQDREAKDPRADVERDALLGARARARAGARRHHGARRSTSLRARRCSTRCRSATRGSSIDVLPNRPDLLSHLGLAREIAAVTRCGARSSPTSASRGSTIPAPKRFRRAGNAGGIVLHLEDATLASRYMGIVVRGVKVGAEPAVARRATRRGRLSLDQQRRRRDELRAARARAADARVRPRQVRPRHEAAREDRRRPHGQARARRSSRSMARAQARRRDDGHRRLDRDRSASRA